jgi:hypothetical protein
MAVADFEQCFDHTALHLAHVLAAGDRRKAALGAPRVPARVGSDRIEGCAGPLAEIEFDQIVAKLDAQPEPGGGALAGARNGLA